MALSFISNIFQIFRKKKNSLRSRCLEVAGERENGHARGRHARGPTTSKRLLRRLKKKGNKTLSLGRGKIYARYYTKESSTVTEARRGHMNDPHFVWFAIKNGIVYSLLRNFRSVYNVYMRIRRYHM